MTTIADKLVLLNSTKGAIRNAIKTKGIDVPADLAFSGYAEKILAIPSTPDPAVYCPANGYHLPVTWTPGSNWPDIGTPTDNQIILLCSDEDTCKLGLLLTVNNNGQYNVKIYGESDTLLSNTNTNTGVSYTYTFIKGSGYAAGTYTTFKVVITPTVSTNSLTTFKLTTVTNYSGTNWCVYQAKFNTPNITSLLSCFEANSFIQSCEFLSDMNLLTAISRGFYNCYAFSNIKFPAQMNAMATMDSVFYSTSIEACVLPVTMANLTTMAYLFYGTPLREFDFPPSLNKLISLVDTFYNCQALKRVSLFTYAPLIAWLDGAFYNCYLLTGDLSFPEMPLLTTASSAFSSCKKIENIAFTGSGNSLHGMSNACASCVNLRSFTFPSSMTAPGKDFGQMFVYCGSKLKRLVFPLTFGAESSIYSFGNWLAYTNYIETITTCNVWPTNSTGIDIQDAMYALTEYNQPDMKCVGLRLGGLSAANPSPLSKIDIDWAHSNLTNNLQLMNCSLSATEINRIMDLMIRPVTIGQIATFSGNQAFDAALSKNINTTLNSATVTCFNTLGLSAGMECQALGVSKDRAVTLQDAGNTVTRAGHGLVNGNRISFSSITGTTGLSTYIIYYVVNATTDTFQVSLIAGGTALTLTTDGTGTILAIPTIVSIVANVSITFNLPCTATATSVAATFNVFKRETLVLKGWSLI